MNDSVAVVGTTQNNTKTTRAAVSNPLAVKQQETNSLSASIEQDLSDILKNKKVLKIQDLNKVSTQTTKFLKSLFCDNEAVSDQGLFNKITSFQQSGFVRDPNGTLHKLADDGCLGPRTLLAKLQEKYSNNGFSFGAQLTVTSGNTSLTVTIPDEKFYNGGFEWKQNDGSPLYDPSVPTVKNWNDEGIQSFVEKNWDSKAGWLKSKNNLSAGPRIDEGTLRKILSDKGCPNVDYWVKLVNMESRGYIFAGRWVTQEQARRENPSFSQEKSGGILQINHLAHKEYVNRFRDENGNISSQVFNPENIIDYVAKDLKWNVNNWKWSKQKLATQGFFP